MIITLSTASPIIFVLFVFWHLFLTCRNIDCSCNCYCLPSVYLYKTQCCYTVEQRPCDQASKLILTFKFGGVFECNQFDLYWRCKKIKMQLE
jgi:hypothetical protein